MGHVDCSGEVKHASSPLKQLKEEVRPCHLTLFIICFINDHHKCNGLRGKYGLCCKTVRKQTVTVCARESRLSVRLHMVHVEKITLLC